MCDGEGSLEAAFLQAVGYHVFDGDNLQIMLSGKCYKFWQTSHGTIVVHDFHECSGGIESCHVTKVDGGFGVSASAKYSVVLCIEWVDMSGASKSLWCGVGVG